MLGGGGGTVGPPGSLTMKFLELCLRGDGGRVVLPLCDSFILNV